MSSALRSGLVSSLLVAFVVFQHFELFALGTYPVTLGLALGIALILVSSREVMVGRAMLFGVLVLVPNALVQIVMPSVRDGSSTFLQTFALFAFGFIILAQTSSRSVDEQLRPAILRALYWSLVIVVGLAVGQVLLGMRGSEALFNVFGSRQYLYEYDPHLEFNPIPRAEAFYLEPSYAAFVIGTLAVALIASRYRSPSVWLLAGTGMLAVRSATGLIIFGLVAAVTMISSRSRWRPIALVVLSLAAAVALPYLTSRLESAGTNGSSAYYRLVGPLAILRDTLLHFPLGHPFGSLKSTVADYGILNGAAAGSSLDNGFYVLVFYYGWLGLICCIFLVLWVARVVVAGVNRRISLDGSLIPLWAVGSLFFSGGIMLPEYLMMLWLLVASRPDYAALRSEKKWVQFIDISDYRMHNVQRSSRF